MNEIKKKSLYYGRDLEAMSFAKNYHKWILHEFRDFIGDNILEVGAGSGDFSALLLTLNIKTLTCLEPSSNMFDLLKQRFKDNKKIILKKSGLYEFVMENPVIKFDTIIYINVLEHIEKDREEIKKAYNSLYPHGHLLVFVPALSFLYSEFDKNIGHFRRYNKKELKKIFIDNRFKIIKLKYFDFLGVIPWLIFFKIFKKSMRGEDVSIYDKIIIPLEKRLEKTVSPPFGKNLLIVGEKID